VQAAFPKASIADIFRREAVVELEDVVVVAEMIGMNILVTALKR
jgi:hypothetical protein